MNAIVFSAIWGVVMMFTGLFTNNKRVVRLTAIAGLALLLLLNILDMSGVHFIDVDLHGMLSFDAFSLLFNSIAFGSTLIFFILSGRDIEQVGTHVAEYFALIFFILCGISIVSSFNTLLLLFLGIEIISIP